MVKNRVVNTLASMFGPKPKEETMEDAKQLELDLNPIAQEETDDPVTEKQNADILDTLK